jgi:segregation and condensation protein B
MSLKAKVEAIIYAAEEPVTLEQIAQLLKDVVSAAESAAESASDAAATASQESELLPELTSPSPELFSPEPGPLMPEEAAPADTAQTENAKENAADTLAPDDAVSEDAVSEDAVSEDAVSEDANPEAVVSTAVAPQDAPRGEESASVPAAEEIPGAEAAAPAAEPVPAQSASVAAPETTSRKRQPKKTDQEIAEDKAVHARVREVLVQLITDYADEDRGMEIRQVAGGFRMATKPEHHDVVRAFAKSLKPPIRLSLAALETLAVIAYKQPVTAPEIADIRGVESASVLGTLLDRKLITTAGRKQVIGRPMQYKTSKDFLLRFGLNDVNELPSMEEFSQLASDGTIEIAPAEPQASLSLFEPQAPASAPEDATPEAEIVPHSEGTPDQSAPEEVESEPAS